MLPSPADAACWCCCRRLHPVPFALSLVALRHMSAFSAQMALNLEPVYAIVLAMLLPPSSELTPLF